MIRVTIGDNLIISASAIQRYSSIPGPNYCKPDGFGVVEIDIEGKPLNWLGTSTLTPDTVILNRCNQNESPKHKTEQEADSFLKHFEVSQTL